MEKILIFIHTHLELSPYLKMNKSIFKMAGRSFYIGGGCYKMGLFLSWIWRYQKLGLKNRSRLRYGWLVCYIKVGHGCRKNTEFRNFYEMKNSRGGQNWALWKRFMIWHANFNLSFFRHLCPTLCYIQQRQKRFTEMRIYSVLGLGGHGTVVRVLFQWWRMIGPTIRGTGGLWVP